MCLCRTWNSSFSDRSTTAGWKSSSMASHCSGERNWPLTRPWCFPLGATGKARRQCATTSGADLDQARRRKERTYFELVQPHGRARLVVLGCEVGGRWSDESRQFLTGLAAAKARSEPEIMKKSTMLCWLRRWSTLITCAAAKAFSLSLLESRCGSAADGATHHVCRGGSRSLP